MKNYEGYSKLLEEFIDEMQIQGKLTESDMRKFIATREAKLEAKKFVDENFKEMF